MFAHVKCVIYIFVIFTSKWNKMCLEAGLHLDPEREFETPSAKFCVYYWPHRSSRVGDTSLTSPNIRPPD